MKLAGPQLVVVIDTEEEFDWGSEFSRSATSVRAIDHVERGQEIFDRFGILPAYVVDFPVASTPSSARRLRTIMEEGRAEIGTHLHSWVTPPQIESLNQRNSYQCNLPESLERAKMEAATSAVADGFGRRPHIFKAGRYGLGPNTGRILTDLGYRIDCSIVPHTDFRRDGGPDFRGMPDKPFWLDRERGLLEVPLSVGFIGIAPSVGPALGGLFDSPAAERLRLPGLLGRSGLVTRSRLTPEGITPVEQCRLIEAMVRQGHQLFTLAFHSPSLAPGFTPYVRDHGELSRFLSSIDHVLRFFRDDVGGTFTTLSRVYDDAVDLRIAA